MTIHRVILADDHPLLLRGLGDLVSIEPDFELVGTASTGRQALERLEQLKPDLAILDIAMPELDGLAVLRAIDPGRVQARIIFLSASITPSQISEALAFGAWGFLLKESAPELLIHCLRTVARGERWHPPELLALSYSEQPGPGAEQLAQLTTREREIVGLVCKGLSNRAIATHLGTAEGTVKIHLHNIFRKLKVGNRTSLAALNFENIGRG